MTYPVLRYQLVKEVYQDGKAPRVSYGMAVYIKDEQNINLRVINDITQDKNKLSSLIEKCNRLQPAPCHLNDIIEDFLS